METRWGRCKACGKQIIFIRTLGGKMMPCNAEIISFWPKEKGSQKIVTPDGAVVSGEFSGDGESNYGYISHFATCPAANKFRKRGKK